MPAELTTMYRCSSTDETLKMTSSRDDTVEYDVQVNHCSCPGFKYRGECRHVKEFRKRQCLWDQLVDPGDPEYLEIHVEGSPAFDAIVCPVCGKDAVPYKVDV